MPPSVLLVLIALVGGYGFLSVVASVLFVRSRRKNPPPDPSEWPRVSVVVPAVQDADEELLQQIQACDYSADRLEILALSEDSSGPSSGGSGEGATVRRVSVPERPAESPFPSASFTRAIEAAEGEIVLSMPAEGRISAGWVRSMVRHCTPETPVVVGPTIVEHEGLFLPRLQALSHLGRLTTMACATRSEVPIDPEASNWAVHVDTFLRNGTDNSTIERTLEEVSTTFNPEPDAVATRPPASSFETFLRALAQGLGRTVQSPSWLVRSQGAWLWLVHSALLASSVVAVAVPSWRQPTLLFLLAKMGADVMLTLPAAKHYDQRNLLRSLVPTELVLLIALSIAGVWTLLNRKDPSNVESALRT